MPSSWYSTLITVVCSALLQVNHVYEVAIVLDRKTLPGSLDDYWQVQDDYWQVQNDYWQVRSAGRPSGATNIHNSNVKLLQSKAID